MGLLKHYSFVSTCVLAAATAGAVLSAGTASAQSPLRARGADSVSAPAVVTRDADGRIVVRATRITESIVVDGRLDEAAYSTIEAITDFVQQEPNEGAPTTEKTEVWLFFDDRNIYVSARCWDSEPDRQIANEMRRDGQGTNDNESFGVVFDTFYDRRNGFLFQTTLAGGLFDGYITDERDMNRDWNTVWDARADRTEDGYGVEMVIPFKSLRYRAGETQVWGVNFKRVIRWKNEMTYLAPIPAALGRRGINKISSAATLMGIETPRGGRTFELKPYGISGLNTLRPSGGASSTDPDADAGIDLKVGLTEGLTADVSYNTDFAQVEEDEQQVNLTRFNVIFPEKREFFLEGQGIFSFGGLQGQPRGGGGGGGAAGQTQGNPNPNDIPVLFFSRRIGLSPGGPVPIDVGGRISGKAGRYSLGLLDIRTGDEATLGVQPTNFGVVRVKRDILRRSAVGVLFTDRSLTSTGPGHSQSFGADGVFSFYENLNVNTYVAKTSATGARSDALSYRAQLDYNADRYGIQVERLFADTNFKPDVGFMRRSAFNRDSAYFRFSPRPKTSRTVRKYIWDASYDYITDPGGRLESRMAQAAFRTELQNGDAIGVEYALAYELIDTPFLLSDTVSVPVGAYGWPELHLGYSFGPQRRASGFVNVETGSFYDGTRTGISTGRGRVEITPQISVEPGITLNWVDLPSGSFTSALLTSRTTYAISPRMSAAALLQYNSSAETFNTNVRFRWEYQPGSDLFVVYNDGRDTSVGGFPEMRNRELVVKFTRLFRL
jgi:hypothetical protein